MNDNERDPLTAEVIAAAIEVHRIMGPGLLESVYQRLSRTRIDPAWHQIRCSWASALEVQGRSAG